MTKNPIINAFVATLYIVIISLIMFYGSKVMSHQDSFLAPILGLSLFTLSAAVMGYVFCYQPIQLYFDGEKKKAVNLFLQTVVSFGCITALVFLLLVMGVFS